MTLSMDDTPFLFVSFLLDLVPNTHRFSATVDAGTGHPWGTSFMMVSLSVFSLLLLFVQYYTCEMQ